jgi:hypothetical protein
VLIGRFVEERIELTRQLPKAINLTLPFEESMAGGSLQEKAGWIQLSAIEACDGECMGEPDFP